MNGITTIDKYVLIKRVGKGGFGEAWQAWNKEEEEFCVKILLDSKDK